MSKRLFQLIQAMTANEKGHFKKMASSHIKQKKNTYVDLFSLLNDMPAYSDEELKKRLTQKKLKFNIAQTKMYLESTLIKSLAEYHEKNAIHDKLQNALDRYRVYFGKGMYLEAYKALKKRETLAKESFSFNYYKDIIFYQMNLLFGISDPNMEEKVNDILEKLKQSNKESTDYYECSCIYYSYLGGAQTNEDIYESSMHGQIRLNIEKIKNRKEHCISPASKSFINRTLRGQYYYLEDFESALQVTIEEIECYLKYEAFKEINFGTFYQEFWHLIQCCDGSKKYDTLFKFSSIFENIESKDSHQFAMQVYNNLNLFLIELEQREEHAEDALVKLNDIQNKIESCANYLSPAGYMGLLFSQAKAAFLLNQFDISLDWIEKLLDYSKPHLRQDIIAVASMFRLINHYQLENYVVLPYFIKQTYRSFKKMNRTTAFDKWIFKSLRKLNNIQVHQFKKQEIEKLKQEYLALENYKAAPATELDYSIWFDSLIEEKPIFEIIVKRRKEI